MKQLNNVKGLRYHFTTDIPSAYDRTILRALPCTPHMLYVYWELPLQNTIVFERLQLRLCYVDEATGVKSVVSSGNVQATDRASYITIPEHSEYAWVVELGSVDADGTFSLICSTATSAVVRQVKPAADELLHHSPDRDSAQQESMERISGTTGKPDRRLVPTDTKKVAVSLSSWQVPGSLSQS